MKCPNCGKEIANDSYYCEFCGTRIKEVEQDTDKKAIPKNKNKWPLFLCIFLLIVLSSFLGWLIYRDFNICNDILSLTDHYSLGGWTSTNHRNNSYSSKEYEIRLDSEDELVINYSISSEENQDHLIIEVQGPKNGLKCKNDTICKVSGYKLNVTCYHTIDTPGIYTLKMTYKKDGSVNHYDDKATIKDIQIRRNHILWLKHYYYHNPLFQIF